MPRRDRPASEATAAIMGAISAMAAVAFMKLARRMLITPKMARILSSAPRVWPILRMSFFSRNIKLDFFRIAPSMNRGTNSSTPVLEKPAQAWAAFRMPVPCRITGRHMAMMAKLNFPLAKAMIMASISRSTKIAEFMVCFLSFSFLYFKGFALLFIRGSRSRSPGASCPPRDGYRCRPPGCAS